MTKKEKAKLQHSQWVEDTFIEMLTLLNKRVMKKKLEQRLCLATRVIMLLFQYHFNMTICSAEEVMKKREETNK